MGDADCYGEKIHRDGEEGGANCLQAFFIRPKETHKRKSLIGPIFLNGGVSPVRAGPQQVHPGFPELGMTAFSNRRGQAGVRWH